MAGIAVNEQFCRALSVALLHSLWQGLLLGVVGAIFGKTARRLSPRYRYAIFLLLQSVLLATFVGTVYWTAFPTTNLAAATVAPMRSANDSLPYIAESPSILPSMPVRLPSERASMGWQKAVAVGYLLCVAGMLFRLIIGLWGGKRMIRASSPIVQAHVLMAIARAVKAMELGYIPAVAYCNSVVVPSVVGVLRPTLLLPITVLSGLSPQQIEVLVMHELAHICRCDHLFNLWQRLLESFFFYHPATWYLSLKIRAERELCCDDCVVARGGLAEQYAKSLLRMAEISVTDPLTNVQLVTLAATGRRSELRSRIIRILEDQKSPPVRLKRIGAIIATMILVVCMITPLTFALRIGASSNAVVRSGTTTVKSNYRQLAPANWPDLHAAAAYGTREEVQAILANGADPNSGDSNGWTPIFYAIKFERPELIACLLNAHANVNFQGSDGCTPLHAALGLGPLIRGPTKFTVRIDILKLLLSWGANPNIPWNTGFTALHQAVSTRNADAVLAILSCGGDVSKRNTDGRTAIHLAAGLVPCNPEIIAALLSHGADARDLDPNGWSSIDLLCRSAHEDADSGRGRFDQCAQLLLGAGSAPGLLSKVVLGMESELSAAIAADPEIVNRRMEKMAEDIRPIHWAAIGGSPTTCKLLIDAGADVNLLSSANITPLGYAAARQTHAVEMINILLTAGAQANPKDAQARLPIFSAIEGANPTVLRLLLDAGAQPNRIQSGYTILQRLASLEKLSPNPSRLTMAEMLLSAGVDVNVRNKTDSTALHFAAQGSRIELVRLFLQHGAQVDAVDKSGRTPLLLAASVEPISLPIVEELLKFNADPHIADAGGRTAAALLRGNRDRAIVALGESLK